MCACHWIFVYFLVCAVWLRTTWQRRWWFRVLWQQPWVPWRQRWHRWSCSLRSCRRCEEAAAAVMWPVTTMYIARTNTHAPAVGLWCWTRTTPADCRFAAFCRRWQLLSLETRPPSSFSSDFPSASFEHDSIRHASVRVTLYTSFWSHSTVHIVSGGSSLEFFGGTRPHGECCVRAYNGGLGAESPAGSSQGSWSGSQGWNTFSFWTFTGSRKFDHFSKIWKRKKITDICVFAKMKFNKLRYGTD